MDGSVAVSTAERVYNPGEITEHLKRLPKWHLDSGLICRRYETTGWKASMMVANAIGHLAEAAWHHPDLHISYNRVGVTLMNHAANGITDKDFELAAKIESLIMWQPGAEQGALLGTPQDPQYRYVKYQN
jgi:4a-hydroxytetrahydrobiopterin dehydratase